MYGSVRFSPSFIKDLNEANNVDDPHLNEFLLDSNKGAPVVQSKLSEFPEGLSASQGPMKMKTLQNVLSDYSDTHPNAINLDASDSNLPFLQNTIKSLVGYDTQLGEANINLKKGAVPQLRGKTARYRPQ